MSEVWGTVYQMERDKALGQDADSLRTEIARLRVENWQLKGALGYPVPGDIPQGDFHCGMCAVRASERGPQISDPASAINAVRDDLKEIMCDPFQHQRS
jgi:hypothetical protein